jgi:MFS superfamily sulfate permease-like transporter
MNTTSLQANPPTRMQRIGKWLPDVTALRHYQRAWLSRGDLVAGLVLCALLVPQGMAYAELAGLPSR